MKKVLFVAYGGGHVRMLIPVARLLREQGLAEPVFVGLTTARSEVERAGFPCVGFSDFVEPGDEASLQKGRELAAALPSHAISFEESAAYLGLSYGDLRARHGADADAQFARLGRQSFLPVPTLRRILRRLSPAVVVATSAPRAERAAMLAARAEDVPALCLVDLFAAYEVEWLREPGYADCVCVLNDAVRRKLLDAGRPVQHVVVTGNPAFDSVYDPAVRERGAALRRARGWDGPVWLWASQLEPAAHVTTGEAGDQELPRKILRRLQGLTKRHPGLQLVIRPHPSEGELCVQLGERQWLSTPDEPLHELLWACDGAVTLTSTVGLEAHLAGCRVVQVLGSLYSADAPYLEFGIADEAVELDQVAEALMRQSSMPRHPVADGERAAPRVLHELEQLL